MTELQLVALLVWLFIGCAMAAGLWLLWGKTRRSASAGSQMENSYLLQADVLAQGGENEADDYPMPLGLAARQALAEKLTRRRPRLYSSHFTVPGGGNVGDAQSRSVVEQVVKQLDDQWAVFRGLRVPGAAAAITALLVGPGGIIALDVPATGAANGARAAQESAALLGEYLARKGFQSKNSVRPVLVATATPAAPDGVEVWPASELDARLGELIAAETLTRFRANRIIAALEEALIEQAAAS